MMNYRKSWLGYSVNNLPIVLLLPVFTLIDTSALYFVHFVFSLYLIVIFYAPVWKHSATIDKSPVFHFHRFFAELNPDFNFILANSTNSDIHSFLQVRYAKRIANVREQHRGYLKTIYGTEVNHALLVSCLVAFLSMYYGNHTLSKFTEETVHLSPMIYVLMTLIVFQIFFIFTIYNVRHIHQIRSCEEKELQFLLYAYSQISDKHQEDINTLRNAATSTNRLNWLT